MSTIVFGLIAVALLASFTRIAYELRTGKFFIRGSKGKVYAARAQNPRLYWTSIIREILAALFVTSIVGMNWFTYSSKH